MAPKKRTITKTKAQLEQELATLKNRVAIALDDFMESGRYDNLCRDAQKRFKELAQLSDAKTSILWGSAKLSIELDRFDLPINVDVEDFLSDVDIIVKTKDGKEIGVDYVEIENIGCIW